jgi:hypothetical protein
MNPMELFRQETASLQLSLDEIVARATRELWTYGDFDTVQRANAVIIRGACLAAVESLFKAREEGGDVAASKMREEIRGLKTQLESCQKGRQVPAKPQWIALRKQEKTDQKALTGVAPIETGRATCFWAEIAQLAKITAFI